MLLITAYLQHHISLAGSSPKPADQHSVYRLAVKCVIVRSLQHRRAQMPKATTLSGRGASTITAFLCQLGSFSVVCLINCMKRARLGLLGRGNRSFRMAETWDFMRACLCSCMYGLWSDPSP